MLAQTFDVTALCFERQGTSATRDRHDVKAAVERLGHFGSIESFPVPQNGRRMRYVWDHLRSAATGRAYTRYVYSNREFAARLRELLSTQSFDLVHMDSLDLADYLPMLEGLPIVCVHHNVESALLRRRSRFVNNPLASRYYGLQARWVADVERAWAPKVALNVMVSDEDRRELEDMAGGGRYLVVPNGVDVDEFQPGIGKNRGVAYVGGTNWFPNLDALHFFSEEILPHLRAAGFDQPVRWLGSASEEQKADFKSRFDIELTGYLVDIRPSMQDAFCHIVPLRAGGGTRLKILSSWAMGKPVVSTSIGCEGLAARDGENILVRDDAEGFAKAILDLARDESLRKRLGQAARRTAEDVYSWDVIGREMTRHYLELIPAERAAARGVA
jgi:glycosyltransferase involved in cell wall biosynthesis